MKKFFNTILILLATSIVFGQTAESSCGSYYPIKKGNSWTQENFDKKGKLTSTSTTTVKSVTNSNDKTDFTLEIISKDPKPKKDQEDFKQEIKYTCKNGDLSVDMNSFITPEMAESWKSLDINIETENIIIPANLSKGQKLNDGKIIVTMSTGMVFMTINVVNRVAQGTESITTDAGTFDCMLITYDVNSKIGFIKTTSSVKEWISPKVGLVKSENYDKKGKLMNSSKLKSFSN